MEKVTLSKFSNIEIKDIMDSNRFENFNVYNPNFPNDYNKVIEKNYFLQYLKEINLIDNQNSSNFEFKGPSANLQYYLLKKKNISKVNVSDQIYFRNVSIKSSFKTAENILFKMGWKGKGLGKFEQGITSPLYTKIIGKKGEAQIINENSIINK